MQTNLKTIVGMIFRLGLVETIARLRPDIGYPIRDFFVYRRIRIETIRRAKLAHIDVARAIGDALSYVFGAGTTGDIAEFGTQTARSSVALASGASFFNSRHASGRHPHPPKKIDFFDSFEGLPSIENPVDQTSPQVVSGIWGQGGLAGYSEQGFRKIIVRFADRFTKNLISVHGGWFKDSVKKLPEDTEYSLVHIDGDLYQSAMDSLGQLFARGMIAEGCLILFDDFNCNKASPQFGERKAFIELVESYRVSYSDWKTYGHMCQGFLIHGYQRESKIS